MLIKYLLLIASTTLRPILQLTVPEVDEKTCSMSYYIHIRLICWVCSNVTQMKPEQHSVY